ncbi:unnamed protein product [Ambrosiozyma monospora]|uniref:Unnamed protein product n=1 Tax=Ambrosiozyma monospora TaxID=43982 RepID=A0A9W7DKH0_AMBMO|nr:unnamed protein product [Ambrosiozyma monospora]
MDPQKQQMFEQHSSAMTIPNSNNADPSQPINISFNNRNGSVYQNPRVRRESIAHTQGMGGVSWGSVTIGSWLRDEVMLHNQQQTQQLQPPTQQKSQANIFLNNSDALSPFFGAANTNQFVRGDSLAMSPSFNTSSYLADLEANYCKDYSCCGQLLPTLHDLLRHYEEMHIQTDVPVEAPRLIRPVNNGGMDIVSTNEVFLSPHGEADQANGNGYMNQQIPNQQGNLNNFNFEQAMAAANGNGQYDESNQFQSGNGQLKQQQFQQIPNAYSFSIIKW